MHARLNFGRLCGLINLKEEVWGKIFPNMRGILYSCTVVVGNGVEVYIHAICMHVHIRTIISSAFPST